MEAETWALGGGAAVVGAILTMVGKFALDLFSISRKAAKDENALRFEQLEAERKQLNESYSALRADLMNQIMALRQEVLALQKQNLDYAVENAALKAQVSMLQSEIEELREELKTARDNAV